jgi:hypothetical protein
MIVLLLSFMATALWLVPRVLFRSELRIPARVPQEWIDDYHSGSR